MIEVIYIIIALGATVLVHELGHFIAAKAQGIKVEKFSLGWGPKLVSFKKGDTEYIISWLVVLGGYCLLEGEHPNEASTGSKTAFLNQPVYKKMIVAFAGVMQNYIFAFLLLWIVFAAGSETLKPQVGEIKQGYPAYAAGMMKGDLITSINGKKILYWNELTETIKDNGAAPLDIKLLRDGKEVSVTLSPKVEETEDVLKEKSKRPFIGVSPLAALPVVDELEKNYPAYSSGLKKGDIITEVNGSKIQYWDEVTYSISKSGGKQLTLKVQRKGEPLEFTMTPKMEKFKGEEKEEPVLGIIPEGNILMEKYGFVGSLTHAYTNTIDFTVMTVKALYKMITRKIEPDVAGPIGVLEISYKVAKTGIINLLMLFALININLAIVNILPLLPLDGGLVLMFLIEGITGKPVPLKVQESLMQIGWFLLIAMLIFFSYKDILRIVKGG
jgi:regulator of sigma E protease